jgi:hypothetical protein
MGRVGGFRSDSLPILRVHAIRRGDTMSTAGVLWILGGWFVLAAIAGIMIGRMISQNSLADAPDGVDSPVPADRPAEDRERESVAA